MVNSKPSTHQAKNDYRFEDQGGLNERKDDSVF